MMAALAHDLSENARPLPPTTFPSFAIDVKMPSVRAWSKNRRSGEKAEILISMISVRTDVSLGMR